MEDFRRGLTSRGTTLDTDGSSVTRLSQRPASSCTKGGAFEDLGSDFGSGKRSSQLSTAISPRNFSSRSSTSSANNPIELDWSSDLSDDEIDLFSSANNSSSDCSPLPVKATKPRKTKLKPVAPLPLYTDHHKTDPNYKPFDLKNAKIPKKSSVGASTVHTPQNSQGTLTKAPDAGPSSSSRPAQPRTSSPATVSDQREGQKKKVPLRERSPNQDRNRSRRPPTDPWKTREKDGRRRVTEEADKTPRPSRSRPAPRPVNNGTASSLGKSQTFPDISSQDEVKEKSQSLSRSQSIHEYSGLGISPPKENGDDSDGISMRSTSRKAKTAAKGDAKTLAPFPVLAPLASPSDDSDETGSKQVRAKEKGRDKLCLDPIGKLSPLHSQVQSLRKGKAAAFPTLSPLSSPSSRRSTTPPSDRFEQVLSGIGGAIMSPSKNNELAASHSMLRPFPKEAQMLTTMSRGSPVRKRHSPGSGNEAESRAHRQKQRRAEGKFAGSDSDDDMFLDPSVDPKTLCPWCDERLPSKPTPHLRALVAAAKRVSRPDDRPSNPFGLHAPLTVFVGVCQRHRFERDWIPRARRKGWPTVIEWGRLAERIAKLNRHLKAIVDDVDEEFAAYVGRPSGSNKVRPRKENEFWKEVVKNVREKGSRQTAGVRGQFSHFNKTQPGYYGELGFMIIHQTLCNHFPPAAFHPDATLPLTPSDFISLVLVPEAAVHLIIQDLDLSRAGAIETLRESVEYGVAMFPADEGEGDMAGGSKMALGAGERMFMERARARRKELEEEERQEEEEARQAKPKPRPRPRAKVPGGQTDVESVGRASSPLDVDETASSSAKRKAHVASRSRTISRGAGVGKEVIELSSDTGDSDATGSSKRRKKARVVDRRSDVEVDAARSSATEATPKAKVRPRPQVKPRTGSIASTRQDDDGAPSDEDELPVRAPLSSSQSLPPVSWHHQGRPAMKMSESGTMDATPRAKTKVRSSGTSPTVQSSSSSSLPGGEIGARLPLQIARERRQRDKGRDSSSLRSMPSGVWSPNIRAPTPVESSNEEEPDAGRAAASSSRTRKSLSRFASRGDNNYDWLLNDSS